jgi:PAS domain S-box-containing protein
MEGPTQDDPLAASRPEAQAAGACGDDPGSLAELDARRRRLAEVFERSSNPMLIADDDRVYIDANRPALRLLGMSRAAMLGRRIDDLAARHLRTGIPERWEAFLRLGSAAGSYEYIGGDGQPVPFDYSATANVLPGAHLIILLEREASPGARGLPEKRRAHGALTPREREVLRMVAMGNTGQEIARALVVSPETVSTHVRNIREKLGARSRAHALAIALRRGEIDL